MISMSGRDTAEFIAPQHQYLVAHWSTDTSKLAQRSTESSRSAGCRTRRRDDRAAIGTSDPHPDALTPKILPLDGASRMTYYWDIGKGKWSRLYWARRPEDA